MKLFILAIPLIFAGCAVKPTATIPIGKWSTIRSESSRPLRPESYRNIAIIPIQDAVNSQNSGIILSNSISRIMEKWNFTTVDRQNLNALLKERALIQSGIFGDIEIKELGKKANAEYVMTGVVTKYKSISLETKGTEYKKTVKTLIGDKIDVTEHSENSIRELYSTGARLKLLNVQTGESAYEFDISTENWDWDNIQSFEFALERHLYNESIRSKRDSVNRGIVRYEGEKFIQNPGLHSLTEEIDLTKEGNESNNRIIASKITNQSRYIIEKNGQYQHIDINASRNRYEYIDGETLGPALYFAIENHFANCDSIGVINGLEYINAIDSTSRKKIKNYVGNYSSSFSNSDATTLHINYGINFNTNQFAARSAFKPRIKVIPKESSNTGTPAQAPVDTYRRSR